jgi:hypothetical protein
MDSAILGWNLSSPSSRLYYHLTVNAEKLIKFKFSCNKKQKKLINVVIFKYFIIRNILCTVYLFATIYLA